MLDGARFDRWRLARRRNIIDWPSVLGTRPGIRMIELADTSIRIRQHGSSRRGVIFLCDPPNLVEHYDELIASFEDELTIVIMEQPGFGFSFPKARFNFTLSAYADALARAMRALNLDDRTLVAPCISSYYALRAAKEHPRLLQRLVLMQATDWDTEKAWVDRTADKFTKAVTGIPRLGHRLVRVPYLGQAIAAATERTFGRRTYNKVIYRAAERRALVSMLIEQSDSAFRQGACNCMPNLPQRYFKAREAEFTGAEQPTLILWGDSDPSHRGSERGGLRRYVPAAEVALIAETGHHLELESPSVVARHIQRFIAASP